MSDALPRLDGAFDGSDGQGIDRRRLLKVGAWAAPVIMLATAAPAAAASGPATTTPLGYTTNPNAVGLAPDLLYGASSARAEHWGGPKEFLTNVYVTGATPSGQVVLWYSISSGRNPLQGVTSAPSTWKWKVAGSSNFTTFAAQWFPAQPGSSTGSWRVTLTAPSWAQSSQVVYIQLSVTV
jgi:hypothetical protein